MFWSLSDNEESAAPLGRLSLGLINQLALWLIPQALLFREEQEGRVIDCVS
ncbi:MAG: hypothetical protein BAJALOKI1v1_1050003 [Promethearchaeota archaeon]|nr:MAG: hypothetical protein BAJALOKI1v1_1050003 [Candidatus Lokiarchaeota archaeon]